MRSPSASRTRSCTRGGFSGQAITLYIGITGVWNVFVKLALPVVSLVLLALTGQVNAALLVASLIGLAILVVAVVLFALALSNKRFAHRIGDGIGRLLSWFRRPFHKPPITSWASRRWPSASARSSWSPGAGRC